MAEDALSRSPDHFLILPNTVEYDFFLKEEFERITDAGRTDIPTSSPWCLTDPDGVSSYRGADKDHLPKSFTLQGEFTLVSIPAGKAERNGRAMINMNEAQMSEMITAAGTENTRTVEPNLLPYFSTSLGDAERAAMNENDEADVNFVIPQGKGRLTRLSGFRQGEDTQVISRVCRLSETDPGIFKGKSSFWRVNSATLSVNGREFELSHPAKKVELCLMVSLSETGSGGA